MKFEKIYNQIQEATELYKVDEEAAKALYKKATEGLKDASDVECMLWRAYETSRDCGNEYIDIKYTVSDESVEELVSCMRSLGFTEFTFSSSWSSAVETAWLFQKAGCTLAGLIEINGPHKDFRTKEVYEKIHEKVHGYLFRL